MIIPRQLYLVSLVCAAIGAFSLGWALGGRTGTTATSSEQSAGNSAENRPHSVSSTESGRQASAGETAAGGTGNPASRADSRGGKVTLEELQDFNRQARFMGMFEMAEFRADLSRRISAEDVPALLKASISGNHRDFFISSTLITMYAQKEPDFAKVIQLVETLPGERFRALYFRSAVQFLAQTDPDQALAALDLIDDPEIAKTVRQSIEYQTMQDQPKQYLDKVLSELQEDEFSQRGWQIGTMIGVLAREDPDEAFRYFNKIENPELLRGIVSQASRSFTLEQLDEFWERSRKIENVATRLEFQQELLRNLARRDTEKAIALHAAMPAGNGYNEAAAFLVEALARKDLKMAREWVENLPYGPAYEQAMQRLGDQASRNPQETLDWVMTLPVNAGRNSALQTALYSISEKDPRTAAEFIAQNLQDDSARNSLSTTLQRWANKDAQAAAQFALSLKDTEAQRNAVLGVTEGWAEKDAQAAADWVLRVTDQDTREKAVRNLTGRWYNKDKTAAANWVNRLTEPTTQQGAIASIAQNLVYRSPEESLDWAGRISDENQRHIMQQRAVQRWMDTNPDQAREWIYRSDLPETTKERLLK